MEIDHGAFCREVELPDDVDRERIAANYLNGMLWIEIPEEVGGGGQGSGCQESAKTRIAAVS